MKIEVIRKAPDNITVNQTPANEYDLSIARAQVVNNALCLGFLLAIPLAVGLGLKLLSNNDD
jgi:hypothetical protein